MELKAEKTKVTPQQMALALYAAYWKYFHSWPKKDSIKILLAQWALETGWGKSMWNFNVGNAKSQPGEGHDWCYFKCNEILQRNMAEKLQSDDPSRVKITSHRSDGTCITWFSPKHPWSCFRAFGTLEEGTYDHLKMVVNRFNKAWPFVEMGYPEAYSHALKQQRYYTADESSYTRTLKKVFKKLDSLELPEEPVLNEEERQRVLNQVGISLAEMVEDIYEREEDDKA